MQFLTIAASLAFAAVAQAGSCSNNACLAAVTGAAALGDPKLRGSHCASFLATTVTPAAVTVTTTITGVPGNSNWKRGTVTYCPNEVPNYASACDKDGYKSACGCFGFTDVKTTTVAPTTTTATVYVKPTGDCGSGPSGPGKPPASKCLSPAVATAIVNNFTLLLEFTSYNGSRGGQPGRGYKQDVSDATLDANFTDISDSINWMAGKPIGTLTFPSKKAFDIGQGTQQPEVNVTTLNIFPMCDSIVWRWSLSPTPGPNQPVTGINFMQINLDNNKILKNYAEFNDAAWLYDLGKTACALQPPPAPTSPPALRV